MYNVKKLLDLLEEKGFGIEGESLFLGRIDESLISKKPAIMINNDVVIKAEPYSFGLDNTSYEKDSVRIIIVGSESFTETNKYVEKIYRYFRNNKSLNEIDIIQTVVDKPVAMARSKGKIYKYNIFLDIIYKINDK